MKRKLGINTSWNPKVMTKELLEFDYKYDDCSIQIGQCCPQVLN